MWSIIKLDLASLTVWTLEKKNILIWDECKSRLLERFFDPSGYFQDVSPTSIFAFLRVSQSPLILNQETNETHASWSAGSHFVTKQTHEAVGENVLPGLASSVLGSSSFFSSFFISSSFFFSSSSFFGCAFSSFFSGGFSCCKYTTTVNSGAHTHTHTHQASVLIFPEDCAVLIPAVENTPPELKLLILLLITDGSKSL